MINNLKFDRDHGSLKGINFLHLRIEQQRTISCFLILAKPTHDSISQFAPPPSISLEELNIASTAFSDVLEIDLPKMQKQKPKSETQTSKQACDRCGRQLYDSTDMNN
ncbi:unnamed protein product [Musa acuminata subsp. malaccensis]|uniref:(wild Malaysian banana) hypothetical protein n=1 Tax=Musa acuminata subsp. malaccensis TaxID=214687 RepID=A0A804JTD8_MUSAM|nr:unnamed protein product [Musa acuminata subsp. malaccensis]